MVPTCRRVPRVLPAFFLQLFFTFVSVVGFFAILATPYAAIIMLLGLAATFAIRRARTWIALPDQLGPELVIPVPELPPGDEHRAPLPEARLRQ